MKIQEMFLKKIEIEKNFTVDKLFNSRTRRVGLETEYKMFIKNGIKNGFLKIEKYLIAENIQEELWNINQMKGNHINKLRDMLRDYPNEADYHLSPFIYILNQIVPCLKIVDDPENQKRIIECNENILICPRIDGYNAVSRIYFPDYKIALNSTNDNVQNLCETLGVDGLEVYIIDVEDQNLETERIVAYKPVTTPEFTKAASQIETKALDKAFMLD